MPFRLRTTPSPSRLKTNAFARSAPDSRARMASVLSNLALSNTNPGASISSEPSSDTSLMPLTSWRTAPSSNPVLSRSHLCTYPAHLGGIPTERRRSTIMTDNPLSAAIRAAVDPAGPQPTTIRSNRSRTIPLPTRSSPQTLYLPHPI